MPLLHHHYGISYAIVCCSYRLQQTVTTFGIVKAMLPLNTVEKKRMAEVFHLLMLPSCNYMYLSHIYFKLGYRFI